MKIDVGSYTCYIETDRLEVVDALDKLYTLPYPGAFFSMKKRKGWDGKRHFVTKITNKEFLKLGIVAKFPTGLLPKILKNLANVDITPEIHYSSKIYVPSYIPDLLTPRYKLFPDQEDLVKRLLEAKRGICQASTGAGKTVLMAYLLNLWNPKSAFILTARKQLVTQLYEFLSGCVPNVGICHGESYIPNKIMVVSLTSFANGIFDESLQPDLVLVDEIHEVAKGKVSMTVIEKLDCFHKYGFTATVPEDKFDRLTVESVFGSVIRGESTTSLVEKKRIAKANIKLIECKHETYRARDPYPTIYKEEVVTNRKRNSLICDLINSIISNDRNAKILLLVKELAHIEEFKKLKLNCIIIQGDDDIQTRYEKTKKFIDFGNVLLGTNVLQTGINIPCLGHLIDARGLASNIATIQAIGRILRLHETTPEVYVYDIQDDCRYLDDHSQSRIDAYEKEGYVIEKSN